MINFAKYIKMFCILYLLLVTSQNNFAEGYYEYERIPKTVKEYAYKTYTQKEIKTIRYIMKWNKYKLYDVIYVEYGIIWGPHYKLILFDGKSARKPTMNEYSDITRYDYIRAVYKRNYKSYKQLERKLYWHRNKVVKVIDNTEPPAIPSAVEKYADKYMIKSRDRKIIYLMDWEGYHVYKAYWQKYGSHPLGILLYNGQIVRRPNNIEYSNMRKKLNDAIFNYAVEQGRLHNKD